MAVNYTNAVKTARMTATRDHFAGGKIQIGTADMAAVLVEYDITEVGGSISGDMWTIALDNTTVAAVGTGTAAAARIVTSAAANDLTGLTVGTSSANVVLDNTSINTGQNVTLSSAAIQHAA